MKKVVVLFIVLLLFPFISAEIIIRQQPQEIYNLGNVVTVPVTIKSASDISGILNMNLLCGGTETNFYKNGVSLSAGEEKRTDASLVLTQDIIGGLKGNCKIKASLGEEFVLTNDFRISDLLILNTDFTANEFSPGENILIEGQASRENGQSSNGFIEILIIEGNSTKISQMETINNGFFSINMTLPKDMESGEFLLRLQAYEVDFLGEITNKGTLNQGIIIKQIPTSLEIVFDTKYVEPGTNLRVKATLHDQTGEKISSLSTIQIKNKNDKIVEQVEIETDEFFEFPIQKREAPAQWSIIANSNKITSEAKFNITEKEDLDIEIINTTMIITNTGNIPYNKSALIKVGNESLNIDLFLDVGKSQKYTLSAPEGNYKIGVITGGVTTEVDDIFLTGKTVDIKESRAKVNTIAKHPLIWIFVILIFSFVAFIMFKKGYQKTFIGYIYSKRRKKHPTEKNIDTSISKNYSLVEPKNKAELSLSIKGDKQNASIIALKIKNIGEVTNKTGGVKETMQKIVHEAETQKAIVYESHDTIFFILAPAKTKTFKNEFTSLELAEKINKTLTHHNKMFKQKINFGISLNYGPIIAKQEPHAFKFMSMGTLMNSAKKISSIADSDILLGEKMHDQLRSSIKSTKHEKGGVTSYSIKEIKKTKEHEKFIRGFLDRMDKEDKAKK